MRRSDREIKDVDRILNIVDKCKVARLGIVDGGRPYVVALNFGYRRIDNDITLYFHSACEGRKIQVMRENPYVCFEMDCAHGLIEGKKPCAFSFAYESVVGSGKIEFIENREEKNEALNLITSIASSYKNILPRLTSNYLFINIENDFMLVLVFRVYIF